MLLQATLTCWHRLAAGGTGGGSERPLDSPPLSADIRNGQLYITQAIVRTAGREQQERKRVSSQTKACSACAWSNCRSAKPGYPRFVCPAVGAVLCCPQFAAARRRCPAITGSCILIGIALQPPILSHPSTAKTASRPLSAVPHTRADSSCHARGRGIRFHRTFQPAARLQWTTLHRRRRCGTRSPLAAPLPSCRASSPVRALAHSCGVSMGAWTWCLSMLSCSLPRRPAHLPRCCPRSRCPGSSSSCSTVLALCQGTPHSCSHPLADPPDTVKARLQVQGSGGAGVLYRGTADAFAKIAAREVGPGRHAAGCLHARAPLLG